MKVLQINAVYKNGSTGRNMYELHTVMQQNGIESFVAVPHNKCNDNECYQIGSIFEQKLHGIASRVIGLQGYFSISATKKLIQYIKKLSPDIVHLHNVHANYLNLPLLFSFLATQNIATVITLHDCWFYTGKCTHYTIAKCFKWKNGCCNCPQLKLDNNSWFFDWTTKMWVDKKKWYDLIPRLAVIGVSDWITGEAKQSVLQSARFIERIYNWIDLDLFRPQKVLNYREFNDKFVILGVASSWSEKKGLLTFLKLASHLRNDEVILLVGNMPKLDLPTNVVHINATQNVQELVNYYCLSGVFLQLSREESFGKVVAEALACGTPVVTVDSTANAELVNRATGYVCESNDVCEVLDKIRIIKSRGKQYYSDKCRSFAEEFFDMSQRCNDYIKLYKRMLEE